jgi:hypothetical protein
MQVIMQDLHHVQVTQMEQQVTLAVVVQAQALVEAVEKVEVAVSAQVHQVDL